MKKKQMGEESLPDGYVNHTRQKICPASSRFISGEQIAEELAKSRAYGYSIIREINKELKKKGYMTFSGRVLKKAWIEYTGG